MTTALLSTTYFGPVQWYQKLYRYDTVLLEQHGNFVKQTYRNRCVIAATQGMQALTIPVERLTATDTTDACSKGNERFVRISNHGKWRTEHWNALCSAYGDSPFFDYYADDLRPFFEKKWEFLFDFNLEIVKKMCELLDIQPNLRLTDKFLPATDTADDYREAIRPRRPQPDSSFATRPYYQVYRQKYGFLPNLSILDLLFNMGNEAIFYL